MNDYKGGSSRYEKGYAKHEFIKSSSLKTQMRWLFMKNSTQSCDPPVAHVLSQNLRLWTKHCSINHLFGSQTQLSTSMLVLLGPALLSLASPTLSLGLAGPDSLCPHTRHGRPWANSYLSNNDSALPPSFPLISPSFFHGGNHQFPSENVKIKWKLFHVVTKARTHWIAWMSMGPFDTGQPWQASVLLWHIVLT